jgi:hypothetical protein
MNAERLVRLAMRYLFRYGARYLNKGAKSDPRMADAARKLRMGRRFGRF